MKRFLKYFVVILTALFILSFISCKSIADPLKQSEKEASRKLARKREEVEKDVHDKMEYAEITFKPKEFEEGKKGDDKNE